MNRRLRVHRGDRVTGVAIATGTLQNVMRRSWPKCLADVQSDGTFVFDHGETDMGDKGSKDKGKREQQKKAQLTQKEKRRLKKEKKKKK
jgi:hypothetical protein